MKYLTILLLVPLLLFGAGGLEAGEKGPMPLPKESLDELPEEKGYSCSRLSTAGRAVYKEVLWTILHHESAVELTTKNPALLDTAFNAVKNDHPELFYVDGYSYIHFKRGGVILSMAFYPEYNRDFKEALSASRQIEDYADRFLQSAPGGDDYERVKYTYEYIITHTEYDENARDSQNICSVVTEGKSVCTGYARAMQYLLGRLDIPSVMITGTVREGQPHAWLAALVNGEAYHIDPTWGDASYQLEEEVMGEVSTVPEVNYDYFLVPDADIRRTHEISNVVETPVCESLKDNYYVREGAYFTRVDETGLAALFSGAYARGESFLTLKCADPRVYAEMRDFLLTGQHVFDYLAGGSAVAYADKPGVLSLTFWL